MHTLIQVITLLILLAGLIMALFPVLPGILLIFVTTVIYGFIEGFHQISLWFILVMLLLTIFSYVADNLVTWLGARRYGASRVGATGAIVGGVVGVLINPLIGLFIGPALGAIIAELVISRRNLEEAWQVGIGTLIGSLGGSVARFIIGLAMVVSFLHQIY